MSLGSLSMLKTLFLFNCLLKLTSNTLHLSSSVFSGIRNSTIMEASSYGMSAHISSSSIGT